MTHLPPFIGFDAFGTLVRITQPRRPFAQLRDLLALEGANVDDFAVRAMTHRHSLASLAESYGVEVPMSRLAKLEAHQWEEVHSIELYPETEAALEHVLERGLGIVVCSNLAWPYAGPVLQLLRRYGEVGHGEHLQTAFSFDIGHVKPSLEFFSAVARQVEQPVSRLGLIGDKVVEDWEGPTAAGWRAYHLDRAQGATLLDGLQALG